MTEIPNYLVQTDDKVLHTYWHLDILLCDVALNKERVSIFKKVSGTTTYKYVPVNVEELKEVRE